MENQITYFNRHNNMDSATHEMIFDAMKELDDCPLGHSTITMQNWLYGLFDGYDYSDAVIFSHELLSITHVDPEFIEKYPRTAEPNGNVF